MTTVSQGGTRRSNDAPSVQGALGRIRVLVAQDEHSQRRSLARLVSAKGIVVTTADDGHAALDELASSPPDVLLVDMMLPRLTGLELLCETKTRWPSIEVIMLTASADVEAAVQAAAVRRSQASRARVVRRSLCEGSDAPFGGEHLRGRAHGGPRPLQF